jgi:hypothetical protein
MPREMTVAVMSGCDLVEMKGTHFRSFEHAKISDSGQYTAVFLPVNMVCHRIDVVGSHNLADL